MYPWDILKMVRRLVRRGVTKKTAETELRKVGTCSIWMVGLARQLERGKTKS